MFIKNNKLSMTKNNKLSMTCRHNWHICDAGGQAVTEVMIQTN